MTAPRALAELIDTASPRRAGAPGPADAIVLEDLTKTYRDGTTAIQGISLRVASGEAYGILGPNGAGKSTTIGVLGTLVKPTGGRALVAGFDVVVKPIEVRRRIGFAMQQAGVDEFATRIGVHGPPGATPRAQQVGGLEPRAAAAGRHGARAVVGGRRLATLSGGTKRRVDLAASLMHLPPILFLDEPTQGLDPRSRGWILGHARASAPAPRRHARAHYALHGRRRPAV